MRRQFCGVANAAFPAKAGPAFMFTANLADYTGCFSGTGFSREEVFVCADNFAV
jgi:hypothetical protein